MKSKACLNLALLALLGIGLAACGAGAAPQEMPSGVWQMTFTNGFLQGPIRDCGPSESGTYPVTVYPESYYTTGNYITGGTTPGASNQLFYGTFDSQIGGGTNGDSCFTGIIAATPAPGSSNLFCTSPQISQGYTITFYGCTLSEINFVYYFTVFS